MDITLLPTFICVGPGRAGTSWLYEVLLEHPEICTARNIKETQFFNEHYDKGLAWYQNFFEECGNARARGEISNRYLFDPKVPARIYRHLPDCKIIIGMRNPYERIQSVYSFKLREGALNCSFEDALIQMPQLIQENRYYTLMKPFYDLFGKERIFLLFFEDILSRPHGVCVDLFRFLEVRADFLPRCAETKVNQAIIPRVPLAAFTTKFAAKMMRSLGLYGLLTTAKRSDWLKNMLFKPYAYASKNLITPTVLDRMNPVIIPELRRIEALIGRSLEHWIPQQAAMKVHR